MTTHGVIGTQTRWGVIVAHGYIAGERYVWCERNVGGVLPGVPSQPIVSFLPWALAFPPVPTTPDAGAGADVAQVQDDATAEATRT